ncbi:MAG TPA: CDP-alcohol phosphatidyltransferase family protein [Longimicrobiales bacterium]|nr:CDP-alcohol phosphatidyltransferase family protein [Longimicrobiales bacterium]
MSRKLGRLADRLTVLRLVMIPALWSLALLRQTLPLGIGMAVAGSTDVLDGMVARRSGTTTRFGSQLDSIADVLLMGSTVAWLALLRHDFFREHLPSLGLWLLTAAAAFATGWIKFRRVGDLHLYSTKVATFMGNTFSILLIVFGDAPEAVWNVVIGAAILASGELLLVQLVRRDVDEHVGSIFLPLRRPAGVP